ncbi:MAG: hypothetical protein R3F31_24970 [Verrucomicrobiales bacterium]
MSAAWSSISSFHAGLFQFLLAKLAEGRSEAELEHLVASLDEERFTELHEYPNAALVNHWNERTPLLCAHELAARFRRPGKQNGRPKRIAAPSKNPSASVKSWPHPNGWLWDNSWDRPRS